MTADRDRRPFSAPEYTRLLGAGIVGDGAELRGGVVYEPPGRRRLFSVAEYDRMLECGVLYSGEPCELLAGEIWEAAGIGNRHLGCVNHLTRLFILHLEERAVVSVQNPLILGEDSEPEPDLAILTWREDSYSSEKPKVEDALLVVEVSDTSSAEDRRLKLPLYARARVAELWIVDLARNAVEVCLDPREGRYRTVERHLSGATISPRLLPDLRLGVDTIVPPVTPRRKP